jgi:hypothetical protein
LIAEPLLKGIEVQVWFNEIGFGQDRVERRLPANPVHNEPHLMASLRVVLDKEAPQPIAQLDL